MPGLSRGMAGHPFCGFLPGIVGLLYQKASPMKWYKPISTIKDDIKAPMQQIAIIAIAAFVIAGLALLIAIGKDA
jgi:hypothetical protein